MAKKTRLPPPIRKFVYYLKHRRDVLSVSVDKVSDGYEVKIKKKQTTEVFILDRNAEIISYWRE